MLNLFSIRNNYWKNGTQFLGKWTKAVVGENHYEYFRLEKRVSYARYYYCKQEILNKMSMEVPDITNAFSMLAKEDTSHGFPVWRPLERNSDFTIYNINSESWFQIWSVILGASTVLFWFYISDYFYIITSTGPNDEDILRMKDAKTNQIWERNFWALNYQMHGQHMAAFQREIKYFTLSPEDPKLLVRSSYAFKNPYAPDRYFQGWGKQMDMRMQ